MSTMLDFTHDELNALNKLLGSVKFEAYMSANDLDFFAMSPFVIAAFKKIHKAYYDGLRSESIQETSSWLRVPDINLDPEHDFLLTDQHSVKDIKKRCLELSSSRKQYIRSLDQESLIRYRDMLVAPFVPTEKQKQELMEVLQSIREDRD